MFRKCARPRAALDLAEKNLRRYEALLKAAMFRARFTTSKITARSGAEHIRQYSSGATELCHGR